MTPGAFCVMVATARAVSGTVAALVTSPVPTSSASARATRSESSVCMGAQHRPDGVGG